MRMPVRKITVAALLVLMVNFVAFRYVRRSQGQSQAGSSISNGSGAPTGACSNGSIYIDSNTGNIWSCSGSVWVQRTGVQPLRFTTATITGTLLVVGACDTVTTTVTGATTGMQVSVSPVSDPGTGVHWHAWVSSADTVTTKECAAVAGTPNNTAYNGVVNP